MFELLEENEPEQQKPTNYTGVIIGAMMLPVLIFFIHIGNPDMGLKVSISMGMILLAIALRWDLRKRFWFCGVIVLVSALHVPVVLMVPWPHIKVSRISLLPIALADLLIILGAIALVERFTKRAQSPDEMG